MLVPVVLVCGFLGSGKTTFLRALLTNTQGIKIAVVRNEFVDLQDLSLEAPLLVEETEGMTLLEFPNSCVCCSAKTAFVEAVHNLISRDKSGRSFDVIVVELSGLTDPLAIGDEFITSSDPERDSVEFRKVITIMDGSGPVPKPSHVSDNARDKLLQRFIAAADMIFLNKADRAASPAELQTLETYAKSINPSCPVLRTIRCAEMSASALVEFAKEAVSVCRDFTDMRISCDVHNIYHQVIHENIIIRADALESLESAIGVWLWSDDGCSNSIWRGKGLLKLNSGDWAELQICNDSIALTRIDWHDPKDPFTRVLLIGSTSSTDASDIFNEFKSVLMRHT